MRTLTFILSGVMMLAAPIVNAQDDSTEILIQVLLRKGILSESEASEIRQEVMVVAEAQKAEIVDAAVAQVERTYASVPSVPIPSKLSNVTLTGNARFRYHYENAESRSGENNDRSRWRYRIRLGSIYQFKESPYSLGVQLETGTSNDSNNANFGGFFDKSGSGMSVGRMYLNYKGDDLNITFGKHASPFYMPKMLWDGDLNIEGLSESISRGAWTFTAGQYIIDEENESKETVGGQSVTDDALLMAQAKWTNGEGLVFAPVLMATTGGNSNFSESGTFSGANSVRYFHDFAVVGMPFEYGFKSGDGQKHKIFGAWGANLKGDELVNDPDSPFFGGSIGQSSKNQFANLGYQMGSAKKAGERQWSAEYRFMEAGAYSPNLSDSDWAKGQVNQAGYVINYKQMFTDFFNLSVTYLVGDSIDDDYLASPGNKGNTQVLLIDGVVSF
ncbi:MAG: putative porin [Verrucomicrobiia bacterium]